MRDTTDVSERRARRSETFRVRDQVAQLPRRTRGPAAVAAGQGIATAVVLRPYASGEQRENRNDFTDVPGRWMALAGLQFVAGVMVGVTHIQGRSANALQPETGADLAAISTLVALALAITALLLRSRMPLAMRLVMHVPLIVALVFLPIGFVHGLWRLTSGEADEADVMLRTAVVQAAGAIVVFVLWRRTPGTVAVYDRLALDDAECARLSEFDPATARRMKDAETQARRALVELGRVDAECAASASARTDERWRHRGCASGRPDAVRDVSRPRGRRR